MFKDEWNNFTNLYWIPILKHVFNNNHDNNLFSIYNIVLWGSVSYTEFEKSQFYLKSGIRNRIHFVIVYYKMII
jgi:hypothetical protein